MGKLGLDPHNDQVLYNSSVTREGALRGSFSPSPLQFNQNGQSAPRTTIGKLRKQFQAAPRFELGVRDLQSFALPLGHATMKFSYVTFYIF